MFICAVYGLDCSPLSRHYDHTRARAAAQKKKKKLPHVTRITSCFLTKEKVLFCSTDMCQKS